MDIVFTYVNSNDENWRLKRLDTKEKYYDVTINNFDSNISARYDDHNELLYSLKSVEKYLPWINSVYIVTDNQIPECLNECTHSFSESFKSKIKIIDHTEIIPKEYLPTFNSHVIELFLHKIPGLSSPFMYLNDDVIFLKEMKLSNFIQKNDDEGKIVVFLDKCFTKKGKPNVEEYGFRSAWKNSNRWLDDNFKIEDRKKMSHAPMIIDINIMNTIWEIMYSELINVCKMRFRSIIDYNVLCSIYIYYCLYKNKAVISEGVKCKSIFSDTIITNISELEEIDILCVNEYNEKIFEYLRRA